MSKILINIEDNYTSQFYIVTLVKCMEIGNDVKFASVSDILILSVCIFSVISRHDI